MNTKVRTRQEMRKGVPPSDVAAASRANRKRRLQRSAGNPVGNSGSWNKGGKIGLVHIERMAHADNTISRIYGPIGDKNADFRGAEGGGSEGIMGEPVDEGNGEKTVREIPHTQSEKIGCRFSRL